MAKATEGFQQQARSQRLGRNLHIKLLFAHLKKSGPARHPITAHLAQMLPRTGLLPVIIAHHLSGAAKLGKLTRARFHQHKQLTSGPLLWQAAPSELPYRNQHLNLKLKL